MSLSRPTSSSSGIRGSMPQMPVISEDDDSLPLPERRGPIPRGPLRVPQRSYRRSNRSQRPLMPFVPDPHPLSDKYEAGTVSLSASASVTASASESTGVSGDMEKSEEFLRNLEVEDEMAFDQNRRRMFRFLIVVGIIVLIILALAIGLGVGLTTRHDNSKSGDGDADETSDEPQYPAGSFTFETSLQDTKTSCTSNPSTWRCYPYEKGETAQFFWIISAPEDDKSNFTVSSTDNPFAPSFRNITMSRFEEGSSDEHFSFSFDMTRNIVPDADVGASNRAARCSFEKTKFEATIWTRRRDNETLQFDGPVSSKFGDWPGDVEVKQIKDAELGQPTCEDSDGTEIADVQAGSGTCECAYSNFDTDS
ncbi:tat pathway signal sequence [Sarocladium implicatum]|nr:tat pathway signal sequence [Sarocladium implicatum]